MKYQEKRHMAKMLICTRCRQLIREGMVPTICARFNKPCWALPEDVGLEMLHGQRDAGGDLPKEKREELRPADPAYRKAMKDAHNPQKLRDWQKPGKGDIILN